MASPPLSQEHSSQCSSARSPGAEFEYYSDTYYSPHDDYSLPTAMSDFSQGLPDLWQGRSHANMFPQVLESSCVSLNQVQGFEDHQEAPFDLEGYTEEQMKAEYIEVDHHVKSHNNQAYRQSPSDEGLGASIKDEGSPQDQSSIYVDDGITDADAEADVEEEDDEGAIPDSPVSDTEYSPKSTRTRKRPGSKASSPPNAKRRVTKNTKTKGSYSCKSCNHSPFKDAVSLQRHLNAAHTRAFICVFAFAGCQSTFASKNEWKRHVSSQHLNLNSWVCEQGACGRVQSAKKGENGATVKGSEFNRKDLFTQHLRRMHAPFDVKRKNKKNPDWEERLKELQVSCLRVKRSPPTRLACPMHDCDTLFEGINCWDDHMEHVGKHLEKAAVSTGVGKFSVQQEDDQLLVDWALQEHIIEHKVSSGYKLAGVLFEKGDDEDAEGEDDY
jgi:hypothetical protein